MIAFKLLSSINWGIFILFFFFSNSLWSRSSPDSLILNYHYFVDWVRADVGNHFKKHDAILMPNSLMKIDLSTLASDLQIKRASLHLYIQQTFRPDFSQIINLYGVEDNSWDSDKTVTEDIYRWPTSEILGSFASGQIGWKVFDITKAAQKARQQSAGIISLKWGVDPNFTPLAWDIATSPSWDLIGKLDRYDNSNLRPFVKIVYTGVTQLPDFHIGSSDIQLKPRLAHPGETVTLSAKIHNFGGKQAAPVTVRFFDVFGIPIGSDQMISSLPAFNGVDSVSVSWAVKAGAQHVRVQVDPDGQIAEIRENNNIILRNFLIASDYKTYSDDFESPEFSWASDFDLPVDQNALGDHPMKWLILPQEGIAYSGSRSILMFLDGTNDDGTIWIERAFPVEPFTNVTLSLDFFARDPFAGIPQWAIVAFADIYNPEDEVVFQECTVTAVGNLWKRCTFTKEIFTGPVSEVWMALGIWARWEVAATFYFDLVSVKLDRNLQSDVKASRLIDSPKNWYLAQNHPNPFTHQTRIDGYFPEAVTATLRIFDALGREVRRFDDETALPKHVQFFWDGKNDRGEDLPNGLYFYSLWINQEMVQTRKMIRLK